MCVHNNSVGLGPHFTITPGYRLSARNHALSAVVLLIKHFLFSRARRGPLEREVAHVWPSADLATRWLYRPSNEVDHLLSLSLSLTLESITIFSSACCTTILATPSCGPAGGFLEECLLLAGRFHHHWLLTSRDEGGKKKLASTYWAFPWKTIFSPSSRSLMSWWDFWGREKERKKISF